MQTLNAPPRDAFTASQVTSLLLAPAITVSAGLERLNASLVVQEDISNDLLSGQVDRLMNATVHGTCKLDISRALAWGIDLVRPYMTITDGRITARFNLGVFSLTTPERLGGINPETYTCAGFDRLYLLHRPVGDSYAVTAGTGYLAAIRSVVATAGLTGINLDGTAELKTLPTDMVWPLVKSTTTAVKTLAPSAVNAGPGATTWLNIVNDLLAAINYRGLWADENGIFRSEPYINPALRPPEFTFTVDAQTIVGQTRAFVQDIWAVPNRWVFIQQNPATAPVEGTGQYTVNNVNTGLTSQKSRGLVWAKVVELAAADQATLGAQGDVIVAADQRVAATIKPTTGPFPVAGHWDVFNLVDPSLLVQKVVCSQWQLPLDGSDMTVIWDVVL